MTPRRLSRAGLRVARWLVEAGATAALALVLVRLLYTTEAGIALVDCIPTSVWDRYHALLGLEHEGMVERLQDADAFLLILMCLPLAAAIVFSMEWLLTRSHCPKRRASR